MAGAIPNSAALIGSVAFLQDTNADKAANTLGMAASIGLALRFGKYADRFAC